MEGTALRIVKQSKFVLDPGKGFLPVMEWGGLGKKETDMHTEEERGQIGGDTLEVECKLME